MEIIPRYAAVFGRNPSYVREPSDDIKIWSCTFPPLNAGFLRRLMSEAGEWTIGITAGLSSYAMQIPPELPGDSHERVELMAISEHPIGGGETGRKICGRPYCK